VQFVAGIVLARLLLPEDFGVAATLYALSGFAILFVDLGLGPALVQKARLTERDKSTAFWVNAISGVLLTVLLGLCGPLLARLFDEPELWTLTWIVALNFSLSLGVVHSAMLEREFRFGVVAGIDVSTILFGTSITVALAYSGAGVLSLVLGPLAQTIFSTVSYWIFHPWFPKHFISRASLKQLGHFSAGLMGFNIVNYWSRNADTLLLAHYAGARDLGYYNRAYNLMLLPVSQVTYTVGRVMFPALAAVREDPDRLRRGYRRAARIVSFLTAPFLIGLAAVAPMLIPLLWGPTWEPSVPLLQILCLSGVPQCLLGTTEWLFQAVGKTAAFFRVGVVGAVVTLTAFAIGLQWGVTGVATAWLVRSWLLLPYTLRAASSLIGLRGRTVLADSTSSWIAAGAMGVCVYGLAQWSVMQALGDGILVLQVGCGAVLYIGFVHLMDRDLPQDMLRLVRKQG